MKILIVDVHKACVAHLYKKIYVKLNHESLKKFNSKLAEVSHKILKYMFEFVLIEETWFISIVAYIKSDDFKSPAELLKVYSN